MKKDLSKSWPGIEKLRLKERNRILLGNPESSENILIQLSISKMENAEGTPCGAIPVIILLYFF